MRELCQSVVAVVCLGFTGAGVAWAEESPDPPARRPLHQTSLYIEDPMAPHDTSGTTARVGTAVGFVYRERDSVTALGGSVALGQRFGRLTVEAEYTFLQFQVRGESSAELGDGQRLGVLGRFDVIRIGPRVIGANSMLSVYVEGGAAVAWNDWYAPAGRGSSGPTQTIPVDSKRVEGQVGFGIQLEHRLQEPIAFPRRIGWFIGWRMALAPHTSDSAIVCRGASCRAAMPMPESSYVDRSMLFQSSMAFTW